MILVNNVTLKYASSVVYDLVVYSIDYLSIRGYIILLIIIKLSELFYFRESHEIRLFMIYFSLGVNL